jgi:hypothetical protein
MHEQDIFRQVLDVSLSACRDGVANVNVFVDKSMLQVSLARRGVVRSPWRWCTKSFAEAHRFVGTGEPVKTRMMELALAFQVAGFRHNRWPF